MMFVKDMGMNNNQLRITRVKITSDALREIVSFIKNRNSGVESFREQTLKLINYSSNLIGEQVIEFNFNLEARIQLDLLLLNLLLLGFRQR